MSVDTRQLKKWTITIMKKLIKAKEDKSFQIIQADEHKLDIFYILIKPTNGIYKDQTHILEFKTRYGSSNEYLFPFSPPSVKFITSMWHPNISVTGGICVDILKETSKWVPTYDFSAVITSIMLLLDLPNSSSPYNSSAAVMYMECDKIYKNATKEISNNTKKIDQTTLDNIFNESFSTYTKYANEYELTKNKAILDKYLKLFNPECSKTDESKAN